VQESIIEGEHNREYPKGSENKEQLREDLKRISVEKTSSF